MTSIVFFETSVSECGQKTSILSVLPWLRGAQCVDVDGGLQNMDMDQFLAGGFVEAVPEAKGDLLISSL